jgi:hypothetical protein
MSSTVPSSKTLTKHFPSAAHFKDLRREPSQETLYTTGSFYLSKNLKNAYRMFKDLPKGGSVSDNVQHFVLQNFRNDDKDEQIKSLIELTYKMA